MNRRAILTVVATLAALGVLLLLLFLGAYSWRAYQAQQQEQEERWLTAWHYYRSVPAAERERYFRTTPGAEKDYLRREREYLRPHPNIGFLDVNPPDAGP